MHVALYHRSIFRQLRDARAELLLLLLQRPDGSHVLEDTVGCGVKLQELLVLLLGGRFARRWSLLSSTARPLRLSTARLSPTLATTRHWRCPSCTMNRPVLPLVSSLLRSLAHTSRSTAGQWRWGGFALPERWRGTACRWQWWPAGGHTCAITLGARWGSDVGGCGCSRGGQRVAG